MQCTGDRQREYAMGWTDTQKLWNGGRQILLWNGGGGVEGRGRQSEVMQWGDRETGSALGRQTEICYAMRETEICNGRDRHIEAMQRERQTYRGYAMGETDRERLCNGGETERGYAMEERQTERGYAMEERQT